MNQNMDISVITLIPVIISPFRVNSVSVLKTLQNKTKQKKRIHITILYSYYYIHTSYLSLRIPSIGMLIPPNLKY